MNDLINRQMAIDAAMQDVSDRRSHGFNAGATRAVNRIKLLPTVEAIPIEWIKERMNNIEDTMLEMAWSMLISDWSERKEE